MFWLLSNAIIISICSVYIGIRNIYDQYGTDTTNEGSVRFWFSQFRSVNINLSNELSGRPKLKMNDELRAIIEADPSPTTDELLRFYAIITTTLTYLRQIGKIKIIEI